MRQIFILVSLLCTSVSWAQIKVPTTEITYTQFTPYFSQSPNINKSEPIEIYSGAFDPKQKMDQIEFIKNLVQEDISFKGKEKVHFKAYYTQDFSTKKSINVNLVEEKLGYQVETFDLKKEKWLDPLASTKRKPSSVFQSKLFWVLVKAGSVTGLSNYTFYLNNDRELTTFQMFLSALIGTGTSAFSYHSEKYEAWLNSGKWRKWLGKVGSDIKSWSPITRFKSFLYFMTEKVTPTNPTLGKYLKSFAQKAKLNLLKNKIDLFLKNQGEKYAKWAWSEILFVGTLVKAPQVLKDIFFETTLKIKSSLIISKALVSTLESAAAGISIQMLADLGIYKNRNYDVKKAFLRALDPNSNMVNKEAFLKEARHYLSDIGELKDEFGKKIAYTKKYTYSAKRSHPVMRKIFTKFYARNISLSLVSIGGAVLTSIGFPYALHYTIALTTVGTTYYFHVNRLMKKITPLMNKTLDKLKKNPTLAQFVDESKKKFLDASQDICNKGLRPRKP